jgi:hypothetical protein
VPLAFSDDKWDDLLDFVEQGKVLPIAGDAIAVFGKEDQPLYPWLAQELAARLEIPDLSPNPTVSEVAQRHLVRGGERNAIYSRLHRILKNTRLEPGPALIDFAGIGSFQLFLTTTFDPLLERALNQVRYGGAERASVASFFPGASHKDLPTRAADLPAATVYHLLGRVSVAAGEFVAWEEDLLDFLFELPRHLGTDTMRNISADLRSNALLAIGLNFSDWLVRLLLRITRQDPLCRVTLHSWLAEGPPENVSQSMVLFFGGVSKSINVVECHPPTFVVELARRWRERHPVTALGADGQFVARSTGPEGLVFLSYAREDEAAARRAKAELEAQGCAVYFDRERLGGGMNFHYQLEDQVLKHCSVFISLVSTATESAVGDNYFRRERYWASERAKSFSDMEREEFYLPFLIHEQFPGSLQHEPRIFAGCQWNHCPAGAVDPALARRVAALQQKYRSR